MADNKNDFSDSNTTYVPEENRGTLRDSIQQMVDANMGRRHRYLNKEEQREFERVRNRELFERLIAGLTAEEQHMMRGQYGYAPDPVQGMYKDNVFIAPKQKIITEEQLDEIEKITASLPELPDKRQPNAASETISREISQHPRAVMDRINANAAYMEEVAAFDPFTLNEDGTLKYPEFKEEYILFQSLFFTDDNGKRLPAAEARELRDTLKRTALYDTEMSFRADTSYTELGKEERYRQTLKDALSRAAYAVEYGSNVNGNNLSTLGSNIVMRGMPQRRANRSEVINYAGIVNGEAQNRYDRLAPQYLQFCRPAFEAMAQKMQKFDKHMSEKYPKVWNVSKRLGKVLAKRVRSVALYTAVGAVAGPAGLGILAVKSAYDAYKNIQKKSRQENMSVKDWIKTHKSEAALAFTTTGLSVAASSLGLGVGSEEMAQAVSPALRTATRVLAVAPQMLKSAKHGLKAFLSKVGLRKDNVEEEMRLAREALAQSSEAALGMVLGAGVSEVINEAAAGVTPPPHDAGNEMSNSATAYETNIHGDLPDQDIQQNISGIVAAQQESLDARIAGGEGSFEQTNTRGLNIERYNFGDEEYVITRDDGANADGRVTVTHTNYGITETTVYNPDGSSFTQTDNESQNTSVTEHRDKDGNLLSQEARQADSGEIFKIEGEWNNFGGVWETDVNGNLLNQEIQQNIVNNALAVRENLEALKLENNGLAVYGDQANGICADHYQIGDDHYIIARDNGHNADGSLRISHINETDGTDLSVTFGADGRISGDTELLEQFNLNARQGQQMNAAPQEVNIEPQKNDFQTNMTSRTIAGNKEDISPVRQTFEQEVVNPLHEQFEKESNALKQEFNDYTIESIANLKPEQTLEMTAVRTDSKEEYVSNQVVNGSYQTEADKLTISAGENRMTVEQNHLETDSSHPVRHEENAPRESLTDKLNRLRGRNFPDEVRREAVNHIKQNNLNMIRNIQGRDV